MIREDREAPGPPPRFQKANGGSRGKVERGGGGLENNFGSRRVFVGNLAYPVEWHILKDTFRECGEVVYADVMRGPDGRSKGCGIVEFSTPEEAALAIRTLNDREIRCDGIVLYIVCGRTGLVQGSSSWTLMF